MSGSERSAFDRIGGEPALRAIVDRFVDRMFDDVMIGFFFERASRERIKALEYEHAAQWLGASVTYSGRPLAEVHGRHPIQGGHFNRRLALLRSVLEEQGVPDDVRAAWLEHSESLRVVITGTTEGECHAPSGVEPRAPGSRGAREGGQDGP